MLALTVFLQLITQYTPKAAKSLPVIGLYFNVNLILVLISVILTIIVLNFHYRGPKNQRVPKWMRKYIIGYFGRVFCFGHESKSFILTEFLDENTDKLLAPKIKKKFENQNLDTSSHSSSDYGFKDNKPNCHNKLLSRKNQFLNLNQSCAYVETQNETKNANHKPSNIHLLSNIRNVNSIQSILNQKNMTSSKRTRSPNLNTSHNLYKNLDKLTTILCQSLKTIQFQDENLKILLLDEIVECQRNLLSKNKKLIDAIILKKEINSSNKLNINNTHIYDEWKLLAMIVDRVCFFIYLFLLIISSCLIFFSSLYS